MPQRGENIYHRKDGRWEARYIRCYENGKAKYGYLYARSYAEVKARRAAVLALPEQMQKPVGKNLITMKTLSELWLSNIRISVRESSYTRYHRIVYRYLLPLLGNIPTCRIEADSLSQLTETLLTEGGPQKKPLSAKTVTDILSVLKAIFCYGRENHYPVPSVQSLKYPSGIPKHPRILTEEDRILLEQKLLHSESCESLGILFTLFTGVRIGELCGLRWGDINFSADIVSVRRTVERISDLDPLSPAKTKLVLSEPKTGSSVRDIPLPGFLMEYLKKYRKDSACYLLTGSPCFLEPHQCYMRYKRYLKECGLGDYTFHALRHTFATRCVALGFDTKSLSEILGHSNITTTLSVYVHPTIQQKKEQMERLSPASSAE